MRDATRLKSFYDTLRGYHCCVPDMRFGQLMYSFLRWHEWEYDTDVFYLEEDEFIKRFGIYMNDLEAKYIPNIEGRFEK